MQLGKGNPKPKNLFVKGQSGNPKGRPPKEKFFTALLQQKVREICPQDKEGRTWLELLVQSALQEAVRGNVPALKEVIDRLEGKAVQPITGAEGAPLTIRVIYDRDE